MRSIALGAMRSSLVIKRHFAKVKVAGIIGGLLLLGLLLLDVGGGVQTRKAQ